MFNRAKNEYGLTLIELLAVVVILGIIASIATIAIINVIDKSKDQAIVANSIALRDSARYYVKEKLLHSEPVDAKITYQTLYNENFIEEIKDPDTGERLDPKTNGSFVVVNGETVTAVCFKGEKRNLCTKDGSESAIPIEDLSTNLIQTNE